MVPITRVTKLEHQIVVFVNNQFRTFLSVPSTHAPPAVSEKKADSLQTRSLIFQLWTAPAVPLRVGLPWAWVCSQCCARFVAGQPEVCSGVRLSGYHFFWLAVRRRWELMFKEYFRFWSMPGSTSVTVKPSRRGEQPAAHFETVSLKL